MNDSWFTSGIYGGQQDWSQTPFVLDFLDPEIPRGVYNSYLTGQGLGGQDRRGQWAQNQYANTQTGYQSALRERPDLSYLNYLQTQFGGNGIQNMWLGMAPEQRGESPSRWSPSTRLIPWG
jgi:hypothetical protein